MMAGEFSPPKPATLGQVLLALIMTSVAYAAVGLIIAAVTSLDPWRVAQGCGLVAVAAWVGIVIVLSSARSGWTPRARAARFAGAVIAAVALYAAAVTLVALRFSPSLWGLGLSAWIVTCILGLAGGYVFMFRRALGRLHPDSPDPSDS